MSIQNFVMLFTVLTHLVICTRIKIFKQKSLRQVSQAASVAENRLTELLNNKRKSMLVDMTLLVFFTLAAPFTYSYSKANQVNYFIYGG